MLLMSIGPHPSWLERIQEFFKGGGGGGVTVNKSYKKEGVGPQKVGELGIRPLPREARKLLILSKY